MLSPAGDEARAAPSASSKGKATMADEAAEGVPCGICLTDSRQAVRGELDCCTHHFCFVCIMAWARVETRCPFCKARFRTIRRPPVPGRLPSERVVTVPERIQVWHPLGNASLVGTQPSVNSGCSVCSCTNDEDLLLLCELCDVAAHTYCAGLGTTVPDEDWFCNDCATSKEEDSRRQADDGTSSDQDELEITIEVPSCAEPVTDISSSGIVDEGHSLSSVGARNVLSSGPAPVPSTYNTDEYYGTNQARPTNARSSGPFQIPSIYDDVDEDNGTDTVDVANTQSSGPLPSIYDIVDEDYETHPFRRASVRSARPDRESDEFPSQGTSSDESLCLGSPQERTSGRTLFHAHARFGIERARTLRNSRNLSNRIMELRQNWSALRAGSVGFNRRENSVANSSLNEHRQSKTPSTGHANKISPKESGHVGKAWKMLEMAKSAGGRKKCNKPSPLDCTPRFSMGNRSTSFSPIDTILGQKNQSLSTEIAQRNTVKYDHGAKKDSALPKKDAEGHCNVLRNCHALVLERTGSFPDRMVNQESSNGNVASSSQSQHVGQKLESLRGSEVASSSRRRHIDPTSGSLCDSNGSGKPKMDVPHPFSNSLSSGRSTVTSPLQFVSSAGSQSGTMVNPEESPAVQVTSSSGIGTAAATIEVRKRSGSDRHGSKRKLRSETSDDPGSRKLRKSSKIAKGEISALAMRELKLLKIDKTHGSDRFKEAARAATHTVLASCGLEHSPELALALPKPVCKHKPPPEEPSVIDDTCKECLHDFVKQAIGAVLSGEQTDQAAASC
uniref:Uncharacterized protein n=1 Tax=Avena sativa TaxID=4498 RepID=A0ACD6AEU9_AVESA